MATDWSYFNKYEFVEENFLPPIGQGETKANQIVSAVSRLIFRYYNNEDYFDNVLPKFCTGNCADISSFANWLDKYTEKAGTILSDISQCYCEADYEDLLKELADTLFDMEYLLDENSIPAIGDIFSCPGPFTNQDKNKDEYVLEYDWTTEISDLV